MNDSYKIYDEISITSDVMSASNHRLILLLMDKCLQHIDAAKIYMQEKDISKKTQAIKKSMDILDYLRVCLNFKDKEAHAISVQLDSIYMYLNKILLESHITNDTGRLDEAKKLLSNIKEGWEGIAEQVKVVEEA